MKKQWFLIILFLGVIALDYTFSQGCSQCKLISEQSSEAGEAAFANNINKGILLLMCMPYIILAIAFRKRIVRFFKKVFAPKTNLVN